MAVKIALCDDEENVYYEVFTYIEEYVNQKGYEIEVIWFSSGERLLEHLSEFSIIMLDISMPEMDGILFGKKALERGFCGKFVMLSGTVERFKEAFTIQAFRFVTKPIDKRELFQVLTDCMIAQLGYGQYEVFRHRKKYVIYEKEICFIQSVQGQSEVWGENEVYRSSNTLEQWETYLDERLFIRAHKQNIVNLSYIDEIKKDIILTTGERVLLSRRNTKYVKEAFYKYDMFFH